MVPTGNAFTCLDMHLRRNATIRVDHRVLINPWALFMEWRCFSLWSLLFFFISFKTKLLHHNGCWQDIWRVGDAVQFPCTDLIHSWNKALYLAQSIRANMSKKFELHQKYIYIFCDGVVKKTPLSLANDMLAYRWIGLYAFAHDSSLSARTLSGSPK